MNLDKILHDLSYGSEVLAYLTTIALYTRNKNKVSFLLLILLSLIVVTETLGKFKSFFPSANNIFVVQNIEMLVEVIIYLSIYYLSVSAVLLKRWIAAMLIFFILFSVFAASFLQPLTHTFPTKSIVIGGIFILASILIFFYEGLKNDGQNNFYRSYLFYISVGLFIFYANEIPVMTLLNYFVEHNAEMAKVYVIINLKLIVSIIFYSLYSFGILWTIKK